MYMYMNWLYEYTNIIQYTILGDREHTYLFN